MPFQNKLRSSLVFRFKYFSFKFSENRARSNLLLPKKKNLPIRVKNGYFATNFHELLCLILQLPLCHFNESIPTWKRVKKDGPPTCRWGLLGHQQLLVSLGPPLARPLLLDGSSFSSPSPPSGPWWRSLPTRSASPRQPGSWRWNTRNRPENNRPVKRTKCFTKLKITPLDGAPPF